MSTFKDTALLCETPQKTAEDDLDNHNSISGTHKQFVVLMKTDAAIQFYQAANHLSRRTETD